MGRFAEMAAFKRVMRSGSITVLHRNPEKALEILFKSLLGSQPRARCHYPK